MHEAVSAITCESAIRSVPAALEHIGVVCQPTSYQLFHHHCFSLSILAVKFIIIIDDALNPAANWVLALRDIRRR